MLAAALLAALAATTPLAAPQQASAAAEASPGAPDEWLVLAPVDGRGRRPFRPDAVFARYLLEPGAAPPAEGERLAGESGEAAWERRDSGDDGGPGGPGGRIGWAYGTVEAPADAVVLARLAGAATLFVNGEAFVGDVYRYGFGGVPVALRAGANHVFVTGVRGGFSLDLQPVEGDLLLAGWDATLPEPLEGAQDALLAPLVWNTSERWLDDVFLYGPRAVSERLHLAPLCPAKPPLLARPDAQDERVGLTARSGGRRAARVELPLTRRGVDDVRVVTFRSAIDDTVQQYAVRPPAPERTPRRDAGLVLTLHGAGVHCRNQAASYGAHRDLWIVAPTNRRPFGFDWQDWGRTDAYEALERAMEATGASWDRVYLTGHSMGGHGAWSLAANDADAFAALAPSAGWCSFDTYGSRPEGELASVWQAADATSRTRALVDNLVQLPTFVLHGEDDDNVPAREARDLLALLRQAGAEPASHFQPGAGHWWNAGSSPGADCVDWPELFALFERSRRPFAPLRLDFTTVDPVVDARHHWLALHQPLEYGRELRVRAALEQEAGRLSLVTDNVRALSLHPPRRPSALVVDGEELAWPEGREAVELVRAGAWSLAEGPPPAAEKGPQRSGPFKRAFGGGFVLVVGTRGTREESRTLLARARHDAETWWYRGNGWARVLTDEAWLADRAAGRRGDGNCVLYGNADTNGAWFDVFGAACPVRARRGAIEVGEARWEGDDLACVFVYPRAGSEAALAGAFADSGARGARLGDTFATFVSGAGFPDLALLDAEVLEQGDGGVLCAGWFDHAWRWSGGLVERGAAE